MNIPILEPHQAKALALLQTFSAQHGWQGESIILDEELIYQIPLPNDPHFSGAFFIISPYELNIRLYLTLPWYAPLSQMAQASEFVIRSIYGQKFGALELDLDHGSLRLRMDIDATENTLEESIERLLRRAMSLGREISPRWQKLCTAFSNQPSILTPTFTTHETLVIREEHNK